MIQLWTQDNYARNSQTGVGANSLVLDGKYFLARTGNVISKAVAGGVIVWVNYTEKTFASDNQTVALAKVEFEPADTQVSYIVEIAGGTITVADEGKYYDLTDADTVDGATESTITGQVQMIKFISATKWIFKIVNL